MFSHARDAERTARKPGAALRVIATQGLGRFTALAIAGEVGLTDAAIFPSRARDVVPRADQDGTKQ